MRNGGRTCRQDWKAAVRSSFCSMSWLFFEPVAGLAAL
jgi:hypothetical protein